MMNAPIVLFVYNRPWHTEQTLNALLLNELANESILYIYCDGPKNNASLVDINKIDEVRTVVRKKKWCKKVIIIESEINLGLANSVINGVSQVVEKFGKIIVLEDDILTNSSFLKFMNMGLDIYEKEKQVYGISGYCFPYKGEIKENTFFLPIMSSWGYATWLDRWNRISFNGKYLLQKIERKELQYKMNFGHFNFYQMLQDQVLKKNDSWAIRFYTSMFINKGYFLYPKNSFLENIGFDGSGVHCSAEENNLNSSVYKSDEIIKISKNKVKINKNIVNKFLPENNLKLKKRFKRHLKRIIAPELLHFLKRKKFFFKKANSKDLTSFPRYTKIKIDLKGHEIIIPDSASFLFMYKEIFEEHIYNFESKTKQPYIIDGGANIGLASIYLKLKYPEAEIIAFEPDKEIYNILKNNLDSFNFTNISLVKKGLWDRDTTLSFKSEGADGGLISDLNDNNIPTCEVEVLSLKPYLNKKVDFLKLDIEGAETRVLNNIAKKLHLVDRIFVEYHSFVNQKQTLNEIIEILTLANFRLHISSPGLSSKSPFVNISTYNNMDMQLNIYGFKI